MPPGSAYWHSPPRARSLGLLLSFAGGMGHVVAGQVLLAVMLVQWFVILHECGHETLFRTRRWHARGRTDCRGVFSLIPYHCWTRVHGRHHKWTGWQDLDPTTESLVPRPLGRAERAVVNACWRLWIPLFSVIYRVSNYWHLPRLLRMFPKPSDRRAMVRDALMLIALYGALAVLAGPAAMLRGCGLALAPQPGDRRPAASEPAHARAAARQPRRGGQTVPGDRAGTLHAFAAAAAWRPRSCCISTRTNCITCIRSCPATTCAAFRTRPRTRSAGGNGSAREADPRRRAALSRTGSTSGSTEHCDYARLLIRSRAACSCCWRSRSPAWRRRPGSRRRVSRAFALPLDGGLRVRGRRAVRRQQDVRGFVVMVPAAAAAFALLGAVVASPSLGLWDLSPSRYAALGALCRRSASWPASCRTRSSSGNSTSRPGARRAAASRPPCNLSADRLDSGIGMLVGGERRRAGAWQTWAVVLLVGPAIHWTFSVVMFRLGLKARPGMNASPPLVHLRRHG